MRRRSLTNDATQVRSIALQLFGRVLAGGVFTSYDNSLRDQYRPLFDNAVRGYDFKTSLPVMRIFTGDTNHIAVWYLRMKQDVFIGGACGPSSSWLDLAFAVRWLIRRFPCSITPLPVIAANDNWKSTQQAQIEATGLAPSNDFEAAILATLSPGAYTAFLQGKGATTGIGLAEIYDVDPSVNAQATNLSARGFVGTGNDVDRALTRKKKRKHRRIGTSREVLQVLDWYVYAPFVAIRAARASHRLAAPE